MKFSLKTLAAAVVLAVSATGASAAIGTGSDGNGELFFSSWDANGSYTFDLNQTINAFNTAVAATGNIEQVFALTNFGSFLSGVTDTAALKFNLVAADTSGARRLLTTYSTVASNPLMINDAIRSATANVNGMANRVNAYIGSGDNITVTSGSSAWAGIPLFNDTLSGLLGFSNAGRLGINNSWTTGLNFERIDALASGTAIPLYTQYTDGSAVRVWVDGTNLHIAAVPEPESYAMLLAGLGMLGFMARRRLNNRV